MFGPIKTVTVYVEDQQKAIEFYTQKLGFEIRRSLPMGSHANWVEVSPPDAQNSLVLYPKAMMSNWAGLKLSLVFYCPGVEATCRRLESLGVRIGMPPKQMQWGIFATFLDLDGNEFGLTSQQLAQ